MFLLHQLINFSQRNSPFSPTKRPRKHTGYYGPSTVRAKVAKLFLSRIHFLWPVEPDPALAMQSIMDGLIERVAAELLSIEKTDFVSADGKKLPAKRFTYGNSKLWGGGLTVASGRHSFVVQVTKRKPSESFDSADEQFISSFKVLS